MREIPAQSTKNIDNLEKAQTFYQMALEIDPNDQEALLGSVHTDFLKGNVQKAEEELFTIKQLLPIFPPKAAYLESIWARQHSKEKEFDHLQEAVNDQISSFDEDCTMYLILFVST
jgi:tetratricopeptide (TPR) repeat protein